MLRAYKRYKISHGGPYVAASDAAGHGESGAGEGEQMVIVCNKGHRTGSQLVGVLLVELT